MRYIGSRPFVRGSRFDMLPAMDQTAALLKSCPDCAAQMPETAGYCPGCGRSMKAETRATRKVAVLRENFAGALAYLTFLPAVVFLLIDPYRRNPFVRFHSLQCLLFWLVSVILAAVVRLLIMVLLFIPAVGPLLASLLAVLVALAAIITWMVLVVKAFQGERFALPLIGDLAEQRSGSV